MRTFFASLLASGFVAVAAASQPPAAPAAPPGAHDDHGMMACAKACDDCARMCDACAKHCATMLAEGKKEHMKTLATCQDCADLCRMAGSVVARGGPFADLACQACADACKRCGDACDQFKDDAHMKACAAECRKCEAACREMLKHHAHLHPAHGGVEKK